MYTIIVQITDFSITKNASFGLLILPLIRMEGWGTKTSEPIVFKSAFSYE